MTKIRFVALRGPGLEAFAEDVRAILWTNFNIKPYLNNIIINIKYYI
jgi:hypothetical protein